ncbi:aminoglycoside phosphotransferase family protein [Nostoc sp. TCL26-01]|uniref:aminoglycoside phosphotransferase family protein n=1 Tax=Nostoc sp. TCL26-01 TaxID=2576904 RepID=UPI0015B7B555|nr:aminoglycoside phosphotransferase family protein [Nostoc sp. TCL26-01]QLE55854.1 aminoglycoside phosphotransferase family protein [Nostoc sp. TCL26-01]
MTLLLNSHNVVEYLAAQGLCSQSEQSLKIEPVTAKNFNLLVTFPERQLLVKQERHNQDGKVFGEFQGEWTIQELVQQFPQLHHFGSLLPELLHFDQQNSIMVFRYLDNYRDLMDFYGKENNFSCEISATIGTLLGTIHQDTFNCQEYQDFLEQNQRNFPVAQVTNLIQGWERIEPEIFGLVPADALKFFALYQRYDSLGQAIAQLGNAFTPACLTHNDLKLNNILLRKDWQQSSQCIIRLIDWERSSWGDPAFDLGTIISSYMQIWLSSLVISKSLSIEESLRLAVIPLEQLQPSIGQLSLAYLNAFPTILEHRPDFWLRVVQFVGFALIQQIHAMIQYQKSFGNTGIVMLQVAKTLLCRPEQSMSTIFGTSTAELIYA